MEAPQSVSVTAIPERLKAAGLSEGAADVVERSDTGNAQALIDLCCDRVRYCSALPGGWLWWDGRLWQRESEGRLRDELRELLHRRANQALDAGDKRLLEHCRQSLQEPRIRGCLEVAKFLPQVRVSVNELDQDPWALTVGNGTLDLASGELRTPRKEDLITRGLDIPYYVNASSDRWRRFLGEVVGPAGPELPGYLQAAVGYSLTGETREQCLFLLYGTGANGKSTFLEILMKLLGPLAATTSFDTFLVDRFAKNTHDLARLRFARLVTARETEGGRRLAEGIVKNVTGGDTISARHLYHEAFEYRPRFKLWLAVNHKPTIRGTDEGIWRRIRLVPFTTTIPVAQRNPRLIDELSQELEGILAWAVKGAFAYATSGLQSSKPVSEATQEYRSSQDGLADFIAECTEPDVTAAVTSKELYRVYRSWSEKEGIKPVSHKALGQELQERGFTQTRTTQARAWAGLALRPY